MARGSPASSTLPEHGKQRVLAIEIRNLIKVYPGSHSGGREVRAVDGIDLEVRNGEIFGLLGPNGAGKTTTLRVCTTRVKPTAGEVRVGGVNVVADPAQVKHSIGVVTQANTLDPSCTVFENIYFHCRYFGMAKKESCERTEQLLADFKLAEKAGVTPYELSGGMVQRLQVARALAHRPRLLFLDEPTAGLDPQSRIVLWDIIRQMRQQEGITVLLTTHYMEEADQFCERVAIIDDGKILVCDTPDSLKRGLEASTVIELRLEGPPGELPTVLAALPGVLSVKQTDSRMRVLAASFDGLLPRIVEAAASHYGLRDVSVTEPTLEMVFISLTGKELRE